MNLRTSETRALKAAVGAPAARQYRVEPRELVRAIERGLVSAVYTGGIYLLRGSIAWSPEV